MKEWESATDYKNLPDTTSESAPSTASDKPKKNTMGITKARVGTSRMGSPRVKGAE